MLRSQLIPQTPLIDERILAVVRRYAGVIRHIEEARGGLVHYVFRITGAKTVVYLKIRVSHFAQLPRIMTDPDLIRIERKALRLYHHRFPDIFPRILKYNPAGHWLLLTDISQGNPNLEERLRRNHVQKKEFDTLGRQIARIHQSTEQIHSPLRPGGDNVFRHTQLGYVLGFLDHPRLNQLRSDYETLPKQMIIGDLSPKNLFLTESTIGICDLEHAHQGSPTYELALVVAHILLHSLGKDEAGRYMTAFLEGYSAISRKSPTESNLFLPTVVGIILYRLASPVIPYHLRINTRERTRYTQIFISLLNCRNISVTRLLDAVTGS